MDEPDWKKLQRRDDAGMKCPKCGSTNYREARQCPKYNDVPVCINCCKNCEYYSADPVARTCRFYIVNPQKDYQRELEKIENKINTKEQKVDYFYRDNKPMIAQRIEGELTWLYEERRKLKEKLIQQKGDKKNGVYVTRKRNVKV